MNTTKKICKRLVKNVQAVSPIIATLMLVLVAVGAAGAFYVWQSGWQSDVTKKVGGVDLQASLTIGGSTTVYEFGVAGSAFFEGANPSYKINVQKGGTGAGILAVGTGAIDIGMSSSDLSTVTTPDISKLPDLNGDGVKDLGTSLVQTHMAYDAVLAIANPTTTLVSIDDITLMAIYYANTGTAVPGSHPDSAAITARIAALGGAPIAWTDVPTTIGGAVFCVGGTIVVYDRSDVSGTEETFSKHFLDTGKGTLEDAGMTTQTHVDSNQVMVTSIAGNPVGLGFAAYGVAKSASGITMVNVLLDGSNMDEDGIKGENPDDIEDETNSDFVNDCKDGYFEGAKKLYFVTVGEPQGAAKVFIEYCLQPEMNAEICKAGGYIGKY